MLATECGINCIRPGCFTEDELTNAIAPIEGGEKNYLTAFRQRATSRL